MNEKLSAFIDNELTELEERQVLAELERNVELRASWERYHLIRAALRNELKDMAPAGVSAAVANRVAQEAPPDRRRYWAVTVSKAVGGLAIAATVAAVAILSIQPSTTPGGETAAATQALTPGASFVQVSDGKTPTGERTQLATDPLNSYLLEHGEFAPTTSMGNMLPYVRTVDQENNNNR